MTFFVKRAGERDGWPVGEPEYPDDMGWTNADLDEWAPFLPHRCDAWEIASGSRAEVLAAGLAFRVELNRAIEVLEKDEEQR